MIIANDKMAIAKSRSIVSVLESYGHSPVKKTSSYYFYYSMLPGRTGEKNPSFWVNRRGNKWKDPGYISMPMGGDVVDLVRLIGDVSTQDAIDALCDGKYEDIEPEVSNDIAIDVVNVENLSKKNLINYICGDRGIDFDVAMHFVKEVSIRFPGGRFPDNIIRMCGFKNDLGGYELRSQFMKVSTPPKTITSYIASNERINVFEGFIDFLTVMTLGGMEGDYIILNSLSNMHRIREIVSGKKVQFYLDNDESANEAIASFAEWWIPFKDMRYIYKGFNDINEKYHNGLHGNENNFK